MWAGSQGDYDNHLGNIIIAYDQNQHHKRAIKAHLLEAE